MVGQIDLNSFKLKILMLADSRTAHAERYLFEMQRQGCDILLATLEAGFVDHHLLKRKGSLPFLHYARSAQEIENLVETYKPDIINPHFASGYGFAVARAKSKQFPPILLHLWGSDILVVPKKSFLHKMKTIYALKAADMVIGDSDYLLNEAALLTKIKKPTMIGWGIETSALAKHKSDSKLKSPLKVIVPRPHENVYNNEFILHALAPLIESGKIEITFPAFGSHLEQFKDVVGKLGCHHVKYYERLERDSFLDLMASQDIYLSASKSDSSPVSMIEAMALGLIPVAANISGIQEWLTQENGFLFEPNNEKSLNSVFEELISGNDDYCSLRKRNHDRVRRDALFEENIAKTITHMKQLISVAVEGSG